MKAKRLKEVKPQLSRIAGSTGIDPSGSAITGYVNRAIEELWNEGEWPGVTDRYRATVLDGWFTLPDEFVSVKFLSVDKTKHPVKNEWFEFLDYGPGVQSDGDRDLARGALDRGLTTVPANVPDTGGPWHLRVYSDRAEDPELTIWVKGLDESGKTLYDIDAEEEGTRIRLPATRSTFSQSDVTLSRVDETPGGVILPEGRKGEITLTAFDGTDNVILAHYPAGIQVPQFRRYFLPRLENNDERVVTVKASRRFRPVANDEDMLQISNLPALELMVLALRSKDNAKVEEYFNYKRLAVEELKKESSRYHEEEPHTAIRASVGFGYGFDGVR